MKTFRFKAFVGTMTGYIDGQPLQNCDLEASLIDTNGNYSWTLCRPFFVSSAGAITTPHLRIMRSRPVSSKIRAVIDFKLQLAKFREDVRAVGVGDVVGVQLIDPTVKMRISLLQWQTLVNKTEKHWFGDDEDEIPVPRPAENPQLTKDFEEV